MSDRDTYTDLVKTCRDAGYERPRLAAAKAWLVGWGIVLVERRDAADWEPDAGVDHAGQQLTAVSRIALVVAMALLGLLLVVAIGPAPYGTPTPDGVTLAEVMVG